MNGLSRFRSVFPDLFRVERLIPVQPEETGTHDKPGYKSGDDDPEEEMTDVLFHLGMVVPETAGSCFSSVRSFTKSSICQASRR